MATIQGPIIYSKKPMISKGDRIINAFTTGLEEFARVRNSRFAKSKIKSVWIRFPWSNILVETLPEELYFEVRTARNKNIIPTVEQQRYRNLKIGIAGLSVGSAILDALSISGGPKNIKIADFDVLEISNLNRIKANLTNIGENKTFIAAKRIWELDPFAKLELWPAGINRDNLKSFLTKSTSLDVFIDAMDNIELKILARLICKQNKIPVLMATDNGDGIILDVERFDLEPRRKIFHGLLGNFDHKNTKNLDYKNWLRLATKIVGPEYLTGSMQSSLLQIGKTLVAVPQLGTSAAIAGSAIAYAARKISAKKQLLSGRYVISLEEKLMPKFFAAANIKKRKLQTKKFIKLFKRKT